MITTTHATRTMAILAFSALVGCSNPLPVAPPTLDEVALRFYSTDSTQSLVFALTKNYQDFNPNINFEISSSNHATMFKQMLEGETPYFVTNQLPLNTTAQIWAAPIAQDGLAIIVNSANPIKNLSLEEIRRIYSGNLTNWQDMGGMDQEIVVFSREEGADSRSEFERLVMGDRYTNTNAQLVTSGETTLSRVAETLGSIAYLPLSQVNNTVYTLAINKVQPSQQTIADNTYNLRSTIYVVGRSEPLNAYRQFFAWIQSDDGQGVVAENYVPLPR